MVDFPSSWRKPDAKFDIDLGQAWFNFTSPSAIGGLPSKSRPLRQAFARRTGTGP